MVFEISITKRKLHNYLNKAFLESAKPCELFNKTYSEETDMKDFATVGRRGLLFAAISLGACLSGLAPAMAQGMAGRPVTLIVPAPAGGPADSMARGLAEQLAPRLGQNIIIDNVPGASGAIAAQKLLRAAPDGNTLMFGVTTEVVVTPLALPSAGYATKDFTPIARVGSTPLVLVVSNTLPVKDFDQLLALSKQKPEGLSIGISGATGLPAYASASMIKASGIRLVSVPFSGDAQIVPQVIGGQIDVAVLAMPAALPLAKAGKVTLIGLMTAERSRLAPDVPSINESRGIKGMHMEFWAGLVGPAKLSAAVAEKVNRAVQEVAADPKFLEWRLARFDHPAPANSPADFAKFLAQEEANFRSLLTGMTLQ